MRDSQPGLAEKAESFGSVDEISVAVLVHAFQLAAPVLGKYIRERLRLAYAETNWTEKAMKALSKRMQNKLKSKANFEDQLFKDVFVITEILLDARLNELLFGYPDQDKGRARNCRLQGERMKRLAMDVDCVGRTRSWLFHDYRLTVREVYMCLLSIGRLWENFSLSEVYSLEEIRSCQQMVNNLLCFEQRLQQNESIHPNAQCGPAAPVFEVPRSSWNTVLYLRIFTSLMFFPPLEVSNGKQKQQKAVKSIFQQNGHLKAVRDYVAHFVTNIPLNLTGNFLQELRKIAKHWQQKSSSSNKVDELFDNLNLLNLEQLVTDELVKSSSTVRVSTVQYKYMQSASCKIAVSLPYCLLGREELLRELKELIVPSCQEKPLKHQRIILYGPHGVGKTAVVRALVVELRPHFAKQYSFQASSKESLTVDISSCLQCEGKRSGRSEDLRKVLDHSADSLLLVFDDVYEPATLLPLLPEGKHCVIFVSISLSVWSQRELSSGHFTCRPVEGLATDDSLKLLRHVIEHAGGWRYEKISSQLDQIKDSKMRLCTFLERECLNMPLAVRLLGFQFAAGKVSLDKLLPITEIHSRSEFDCQAAGRIHVRGYFFLVKQALELIRNETCRAVYPLVCSLSVLPPFGVHTWFVHLLGYWLGFPSQESTEAIHITEKTGLVTVTEDNTIMMHHAVQVCIRAEKAKEGSWNAISKALVCLFCDKIMNTAVYKLKSSAKINFDEDYRRHLERAYSNEIYCQMRVAIECFLSYAGEINLSWLEKHDCLLCLSFLRFHYNGVENKDLLSRSVVPEDAPATEGRPYSDLLTSTTNGKTFAPKQKIDAPESAVAEILAVCDKAKAFDNSMLFVNEMIEKFNSTGSYDLTIQFLAKSGRTLKGILGQYAKDKDTKCVVCISHFLVALAPVGEYEYTEKILYNLLSAVLPHPALCHSDKDAPLHRALIRIIKTVGLLADRLMSVQHHKTLRWLDVDFLLMQLVWKQEQSPTLALMLCEKALWCCRRTTMLETCQAEVCVWLRRIQTICCCHYWQLTEIDIIGVHQCFYYVFSLMRLSPYNNTFTVWREFLLVYMEFIRKYPHSIRYDNTISKGVLLVCIATGEMPLTRERAFAVTQSCTRLAAYGNSVGEFCADVHFFYTIVSLMDLDSKSYIKLQILSLFNTWFPENSLGALRVGSSQATLKTQNSEVVNLEQLLDIMSQSFAAIGKRSQADTFSQFIKHAKQS